jgi:hypothetical protein
MENGKWKMEKCHEAPAACQAPPTVQFSIFHLPFTIRGAQQRG